MPYKCERLHLSKKQDRRVKLNESEREEIRKLYGTISQRKLAKMFNVSRRLICFIGDPAQYEENLKRRAERGGSGIYYNRDKHTKAIRKHRRYKQGLYLKGELKEAIK